MSDVLDLSRCFGASGALAMLTKLGRPIRRAWLQRLSQQGVLGRLVLGRYLYTPAEVRQYAARPAPKPGWPKGRLRRKSRSNSVQ